MRPLFTAISTLAPTARRAFNTQASTAFQDASVIPVSGDKVSVDLSIAAGKKSLDIFRRFDLAVRMDDLNNDGLHRSGRRQEVLGRYYNAYVKVEEALLGADLKPNAVFADLVKIFCIETEDYKAKGLAVIAKCEELPVGRMFFSINDNNHLSIMSASSSLLKAAGLPQVKSELLLAHMIKASVDASRYRPKLTEHVASAEELGESKSSVIMLPDYKNLSEVTLTDAQRKTALEGSMKTSCVGGYSQHFEALDDFRRRPKLFDVYERRYDQLISGDLDPDKLSDYRFAQKNFFRIAAIYEAALRRIAIEKGEVEVEKPRAAAVSTKVEPLKPRPQIIEIE